MSWAQLQAILEDDAGDQELWRSLPPRACPNDGTPLLPSPQSARSQLYCPHDGWRYPQDWDVETMAGM